MNQNRDVHGHVGLADQLLRKPVTLGSDQQRDLARCGRGQGREWAAGARYEGELGAGQVRDGARPRERYGEHGSHARAYRFGTERVSAAGPERHARRSEGERRAQDRAHVAGIVNPVQIHAQRTQRPLGPALLIHGEGTGARGQSRRARQQLGVDLDPRQAAARRAEALDRFPPGCIGGRQQIFALGHEHPHALALTAARAQFPDLFELLVVGAGDGHRRKKGRPPAGAAPDRRCWCL